MSTLINVTVDYSVLLVTPIEIRKTMNNLKISNELRYIMLVKIYYKQMIVLVFKKVL